MELQKKIRRLEELVADFESHPDESVRENVRQLVQLLMELHGTALDKLLEIVDASGETGGRILNELGQDDTVGSILLLYGLHPEELRSRVERALNKVKPYLKSHGGTVELVEITPENVVRLRMGGNCHGCPSSLMTLRLAIEDALYAVAPDISDLQVEGIHRPEPAAASGISAERQWNDVGPLETISDNALQALNISGKSVLFYRSNGSYYAYSTICPHCRNDIRPGSLDQSELICPDCHKRYDLVQAGLESNGSRLQLQPYPLIAEQGRYRIAFPDS